MTVVERIARAICGNSPHMKAMREINRAMWLGELDIEWANHVEQALAVIEAIRDAPTISTTKHTQGEG